MNSNDELARALHHNRVTRRQVLWLFGAAALSGCAASPVGGRSIRRHGALALKAVGEKSLDRFGRFALPQVHGDVAQGRRPVLEG